MIGNDRHKPSSRDGCGGVLVLVARTAGGQEAADQVVVANVLAKLISQPLVKCGDVLLLLWLR